MSGAVSLPRALKGLPPRRGLALVSNDCREKRNEHGDTRFRVRPANACLDGIAWVEAKAFAAIEREIAFASAGARTQKAIADHLGLAQQRIDQIEKRALKKMQAARVGTEGDWREDKPAGNRAPGHVYGGTGMKATRISAESDGSLGLRGAR